jgi:hypothetical protein
MYHLLKLIMGRPILILFLFLFLEGKLQFFDKEMALYSPYLSQIYYELAVSLAVGAVSA